MNHSRMDRRSFLAGGSVAVPGFPLLAGLTSLPAGGAAVAAPRVAGGRTGRAVLAGPVVISSGNGLPAVDEAMRALGKGAVPVEAVVAGVTLVEDDPDDMSVGLGGLPNERGVVELDASVMHGPTHKAGAVASLRNVRNAARVALTVLRQTDHVLIVGEGALEFARAHGFQEENLLTDRARQAWLRWKRNLNPGDDWLDEDQEVPIDAVAPGTAQAPPSPTPLLHTHGTIHCAAVDAAGDLGACTTTSGLSYKIPGRVGDSPIIGAGMFVDNAVGAAGATGRGESVIQSCGAFQVVQHMANGIEPTEACLQVLKWIADHTRRHDLLNERGEPNFGVTMYALRKDGIYGSASMRKGGTFTVHDGTNSRKEQAGFLFG